MPLFEYDKIFREKYGIICGVDEAGRGPLAGDVYAAAVIFDKDTVIDDNQKYAWGLFNGDEVVSVFTVGWEDHYDAMFVGDVYTKPVY